MDDWLLGLGVVAVVIVVYVLFFFKGGLLRTKPAGTIAPGESSVTTTGASAVGAGQPVASALTGNTPAKVPGGAPVPLQGISGVSAPPSAMRGGSNPYGSLSALFLGVGAAGAERPWGPGLGSTKDISPPTSASMDPAAVNAGTVANTAGTLSPAKTHPAFLSGPAGIYSSLQPTLGEA